MSAAGDDRPRPEVRIDQLSGLRTILAPARADRPLDFHADDSPRDPDAAERCPFCEGREDRTPPEVWSDRAEGEPDSPGWTARAVPNLYPAVEGPLVSESATPAGGGATRDPLRAAARGAQNEIFASAPAGGAHEVIVHGPKHNRSLDELGDEVLGRAVAAWKERMGAHAEKAAYVQLIVNEGGVAGASLEHSHAQLYALGFVPVAAARERERAASHHQQTTGGELLDDIVSEEVRRRERLVAVHDDAIVFCPWASHSPFELRIAPRRPAARFEGDEADPAPALATALRALRSRFGACPPLNLWVRTAPRGAGPFGWHVDIAPRLAVRAGFELSTGVEINIYPPERAAAELREALSG